MEIVFDIIEDPEGGYIAECLSEDIFTQANSWDELRQCVKEATQCHFMDRSDKPQRIRLHLVKDEVLAT